METAEVSAQQRPLSQPRGRTLRLPEGLGECCLQRHTDQTPGWGYSLLFSASSLGVTAQGCALVRADKLHFPPYVVVTAFGLSSQRERHDFTLATQERSLAWALKTLGRP